MKRLRTLFDAKLWKFLLVGVINTLVGTAIMFGLYNIAGCSYWVSSAANYVLTSILSFFLNKYFTFRSRERSVGHTSDRRRRQHVPRHILFSATGNFISCYSRK